MKKSLIVFLSLIMVFAISKQPLHAASTIFDWDKMSKELDKIGEKNTRDQLKGIESVFLLIEKMGSPAEALGINSNLIKTAVEMQLRKAGINVTQRNSSTFLYVNVNITIPINRVHAINVAVSYIDIGTLSRDPKIVVQAPIWKKEILIASGELKVKENVREAVSNLVDEFILDYLRAKQD